MKIFVDIIWMFKHSDIFRKLAVGGFNKIINFFNKIIYKSDLD